MEVMIDGVFYSLDGELLFTVPNENPESIIQGLDLRQEDHVAAVGGSGDLAFAMLEHTASVVAFNTSPEQAEYMQKRLELLKAGDFEKFLEVTKFGFLDDILRESTPAITYDYSQEHLLEVRNEYFRQGNRLEIIRAKLDDFRIVHGDYFQAVANGTPINKVFLSNILTFQQDDIERLLREFRELPSTLSEFAKILPTGGLIYVTNHGDLVGDYSANILDGKYRCLHIEDMATKDDILPKELVLDQGLSKTAMH